MIVNNESKVYKYLSRDLEICKLCEYFRFKKNKPTSIKAKCILYIIPAAKRKYSWLDLWSHFDCPETEKCRVRKIDKVKEKLDKI